MSSGGKYSSENGRASKASFCAHVCLSKGGLGVDICAV